MRNSQNDLFNDLTTKGIGSNTEIVTGTGLTTKNISSFGRLSQN